MYVHNKIGIPLPEVTKLYNILLAEENAPKKNSHLAFYTKMLQTGKHPITGKPITETERTNAKIMTWGLALQLIAGSIAISKIPQANTTSAKKVNNSQAGQYLAKKAPNQVTAGTRELVGQYVDDLGRVQPWKAYYDKYGRLIARTDYNAGNKAQEIPGTHCHLYEWCAEKNPYEYGSHIKGEYKP